ncbi:potassium channel family protein [Flagellimonas allohymeniacidonis]|uniref:Two pore domain potassium channel family protein n=1 Tax=Flagellimonas allohymeniacidonis TaxID=2517819 RepID=A0A4Q8QCW0_9FLAO|nr:potassium channel family protein [Allomuricauda hymeniacidonis]TAI47327.1 two pore domain potassium channel family protein [Allomuricauda hymeniacidonis]
MNLYLYRFELFFITQMIILFGGLVIPGEFFEQTVAPIAFLLNLVAGVILISKRKELFWFFLVLLFASSIILGLAQAYDDMTLSTRYIQFGIYFAFYLLISYEIIRQVWYTDVVNKKVILGMLSGFICLGLIGFFIYMSIELTHPNSFEGGLLAMRGEMPNVLTEQLMYFSFITLMTIGYGEIVPVTPLAQKAAILVGLIGQFYLVIITAVVVGKFINQRNS